MLGFSKGGFPNGPSIVGLLMFNIHFLNNCKNKCMHNVNIDMIFSLLSIHTKINDNRITFCTCLFAFHTYIFKNCLLQQYKHD